MEVKEYDNWLVCLESDNFASFIKVWFAHLASMHDIVLNNLVPEERVKLIADMHGDGVFLRKYKDEVLPQIELSESTRSSIIECYNMSKAHIKANYPEYYHLTYYKKIPDVVICQKEPVSIQQDSYLFDIIVTKTNKLCIGLLLDNNSSGNIPLMDKLKKRYISIELDLVPNKDNLWMIDDKEKFPKHLWYTLRKELWKNIKSTEGTKVYENSKFKLDKIAFLIANTYCVHVNDLQSIIYKEKIDESAQEKDIKEWFHEFTYSLRNVLFHRVVNPFDSNWSNIVKVASQALHDIVKYNIEQLKVNTLDNE